MVAFQISRAEGLLYLVGKCVVMTKDEFLALAAQR